MDDRGPGASASRCFAAALRAAFSEELGRDLPSGTTVIGSRSREGSNTVVAYPMGASTAVLCAPGLVSRLGPLDGGPALGNDAFVAAATALGAAPSTWGRFRVLEGAPRSPDVDATRAVALDRDREGDRATIAAFTAACPEEDLAAAGLALDDLDPAILEIRGRDGALGALAFGRPWARDDRFDDVGVLTAPAHRGQGLGRAAVVRLVTQQHERGQLVLWCCDVDNVASDALGGSLGFTLVQTIASVRLT